MRVRCPSLENAFDQWRYNAAYGRRANINVAVHDRTGVDEFTSQLWEMIESKLSAAATQVRPELEYAHRRASVSQDSAARWEIHLYDLSRAVTAALRDP